MFLVVLPQPVGAREIGALEKSEEHRGRGGRAIPWDTFPHHPGCQSPPE